MRVICKFKDFYDHYGATIDPENRHDDPVVYDRRDCTKVDDTLLLMNVVGKERILRDSFSSDKYGYPFVLEVGYVQYFFKAYDVVPKDPSKLDFLGRYELEAIRRENRHFFKDPMTLSSYEVKWNWNDRNRYLPGYHKVSIADRRYDEINFSKSTRYDFKIRNPILSGTGVVKLLDWGDLWVALDQYLSSLKNDVPRESEGLTDVDRAVNKGFEHPTSFRNMKG